MTRSVVQNLVLLAVAVVVCVVGAEAFLRLFPQYLGEEARLRLHWEDLGRSETEQAMIVPDPPFGFLFRPNFTGAAQPQRFRFHLQHGRARLPQSVAMATRADLVVVGDSMAFGYGVDDEQAWPRLLAEALPAEVINLGMIGAAPQQYLRVLEAFGLGLGPKLVLFMLFPGNDLVDGRAFSAGSMPIPGSPMRIGAGSTISRPVRVAYGRCSSAAILSRFCAAPARR